MQGQGRRIGALCRDGSRSGATGRGACSWHGGVAEWRHEPKGPYYVMRPRPPVQNPWRPLWGLLSGLSLALVGVQALGMYTPVPQPTTTLGIRTCRGTTKHGRPCRRQPRRGFEYCALHAPKAERGRRPA